MSTVMNTEEEAQMALDLIDEQNYVQDDEGAMTEGELAAIVDAEMAQGHGDDDSELSQDRAQALNYYFNRPRGDEVTGRSKVQTSDVMDVIEWLKPDIIEAFTTNEDAVQFMPFDENDVEQCRIESRYINRLFHTESAGYKVFHDFITDALVSKNGIVKTVRSEKVMTKYLEYEGLTSVEMETVLKGNAEVTVEPYEQETREVPLSDFSPESQSQAMALPEVQEQIQAIQQQVQVIVSTALRDMGYNNPMDVPFDIQEDLKNQSQQIFQEAMSEITVPLYDIKIKLRMLNQKSTVVNVPPEDFRINEDHPSLDPTDARFTAHVENLSESDLLEMGIPEDVVVALPTASKIVNEESHQRQYHTLDPSLGSFIDRTTRNIEVEDCWIKVDFDGDGIAEMRHVMKVGSEILINEYADENPFSCISPIMVPHRWVGVSIYDRIKQIQDIGTAVWRQLLDNFYRANNNRTVIVENQVNMDDLLSPRAAGFVRARNVDAVKPFPFTPIGGEAYQLMERLSKVRMERSGVGPEMMAEGMVIDNDTAHGVERLMAAKEKLVGMIIRNFAETGISDIFKKLHSLEVKYQNKPRQAELNGQWITVDPRAWSWRNSTVVKVGLGAGDKIRHSGTMAKVLANHRSLAESGKTGILMNDENVYNALCDEIRFEGIRNPEQYYLDPRSEEAVKVRQAQMQKAQEPQLEDKILMLEAQLEQMDAKLKAQKQAQDMMIKQNEQARKWRKDTVEAKQGWESLDIERDKLENSNGE